MRKHKRFVIESPVTVGLKVADSSEAWKFGVLYDIGARGARIRLDQPLPVGTPIAFLAHFTDPCQEGITLRCEGVVTRASEDRPGEIGVRFLHRSRVLKGGLADLFHRYQISEREFLPSRIAVSHQPEERRERGWSEEDAAVKKRQAGIPLGFPPLSGWRR